jgi:hypothetical protein
VERRRIHAATTRTANSARRLRGDGIMPAV